MLKYFSAHIVCSKKRKVFRECSFRQSVICEDQRMSKHKYPSINYYQLFLHQVEAVVLIILYIFFAQFWKLGNVKCSDIPQFYSWGIFSLVTHLDQSCNWKYLMDFKPWYFKLLNKNGRFRDPAFFFKKIPMVFIY